MSNDLTTLAPTDDGWPEAAAEASERIIRGTLLKFSDRTWSTGKEGTPVPEGRQLVALSTAAAWVKWADGKPVEYRMRLAGRSLPEREELGDLDRKQWEPGPDGTPRDPWQSTRFVYLVDPETAEAFTFSTSSWGGRGAVVDLADQIARMRFAHPGAVPVVELTYAPMTTRFGRKWRPLLKVMSWKNTGEQARPAIEDRNADVNKYAELKARKATVTEAALEDSIPF